MNKEDAALSPMLSRSPLSLTQLRRRIAALEAADGQGRLAVLSLGVAEIDAALPWGGLPLGALHEIVTPDAGDDGAALGFAAVLLGRLAARQDKPVVWVAGRDDLYAPGLAALGLPPDRLVVVRPGRGVRPQWAMEEGVRCPDLAGVAGEVWDLDVTAARRLQLAARTSGVIVLALNRGAGSNAALTRWRIESSPSAASIDGHWTCRWRVTLSHCRGRGTGEEGSVAAWLVEWNDEAHCLRLAAVPGDRPALPWRRQAAG
jgi:protein ImuA